MLRATRQFARRYSHALDPATKSDYAAYVQQWKSHFAACDEDFELERGLNHIFAADWVPSVEVIEEALKASRRLNTFATAVRVLEGLEDKAYKKEQYEQYIRHLSPLLKELGVPEKKDLGEFQKESLEDFGECFWKNLKGALARDKESSGSLRHNESHVTSRQETDAKVARNKQADVTHLMKSNDIPGRLMVAVRVRPMSLKESRYTCIAKTINDKTVMIYDPTDDFLGQILRKEKQRDKLYQFDAAFGDRATQEEVYTSCRFLVDSVLDGYNSCVFAYGATGAGKTHTMMGTEDNPGIMSRTLRDLFHRAASLSGKDTFDIKLSYLEIYNENIRDLLSNKSDCLDLRQDPTRGVVVAGITCVKAKTPEDVLMYLNRGNKNRSCEATGANEVSSRSHAVMQVFVSHKTTDASGKMLQRVTKLSMIDLAGSERAADTNNRGIRMIEGASINRSLLALGNCINSLVDPSKKKQYVNYRDSKLTRLLKDSLGGNCRTVMIANISPSSSHFDETINTLKYASRAISIKAQATQQAMLRGEDYDLALHQFQTEAQQKQDAEIAATHKLLRQDTDLHPHRLQKQESSLQKESRVKQPSNIPAQDSQTAALKKTLQDLFSQQLEVKMQIMDCQDTEAEATRAMTYKKQVIEQLEKQLKITTDSNGQNAIKSKIQTEKAHIKNLGRNQNHASTTKKALDKQMKDFDDRVNNIVHTLPKNTDLNATEQIKMLIKVHRLEMENLDLDLKFTTKNALLQQTELDLTICHQLIGHYTTLILEQRKLVKQHYPVTPEKLRKEFVELDTVIHEHETVHGSLGSQNNVNGTGKEKEKNQEEKKGKKNVQIKLPVQSNEASLTIKSLNPAKPTKDPIVDPTIVPTSTKTHAEQQLDFDTSYSQEKSVEANRKADLQRKIGRNNQAVLPAQEAVEYPTEDFRTSFSQEKSIEQNRRIDQANKLGLHKHEDSGNSEESIALSSFDVSYNQEQLYEKNKKADLHGKLPRTDDAKLKDQGDPALRSKPPLDARGKSVIFMFSRNAKESSPVLAKKEVSPQVTTRSSLRLPLAHEKAIRKSLEKLELSAPPVLPKQGSVIIRKTKRPSLLSNPPLTMSTYDEQESGKTKASLKKQATDTQLLKQQRLPNDDKASIRSFRR